MLIYDLLGFTGNTKKKGLIPAKLLQHVVYNIHLARKY